MVFEHLEEQIDVDSGASRGDLRTHEVLGGLKHAVDAVENAGECRQEGERHNRSGCW